MLVTTKNGKMEIRALWMSRGVVKAIDQRLLPGTLKIVSIRTYKEMAEAISNMTVRGAPTIGAAAAYGIALAWAHNENLDKAAKVIKATRPTAHDLFYAVDLMLARKDDDLEAAAEDYADSIVEMCYQIGKNG